MIILKPRGARDYHKSLPDLIISFEIELIRNSIRTSRPRWLVFLYAMMSHAEPDFCLSASRLSFLSVTGMLFKELCARRLLSAGENEYITAHIFCQHFLNFFSIFFHFFSSPLAGTGCRLRAGASHCLEAAYIRNKLGYIHIKLINATIQIHTALNDTLRIL